MNDNFYILLLISVAGVAMIIISFILLQVRNRNRSLRQQQQLSAAEISHQKALLHAVITSQETERQRIGSDLHDEVGTALSSLRMLIEKHTAIERGMDESFMIQSKSIIDNVIRNVRDISHNLSPRISGRFGFYDAIHELCHTVDISGTISVLLEFDEQQMPAGFNDHSAMAVYRVLAELINNTIKHAAAKNINISFKTFDTNINIRYTDDGTGFHHGKRHGTNGMGLRNIESRLTMVGAKWVFDGVEEKGFSVSVVVPVNESQ